MQPSCNHGTLLGRFTKCRSVRALRAGVANAFHLHDDAMLRDRLWRRTFGHDRDGALGQAGDGSAIGANEVRVLGFFRVRAFALETPDVVAEIGARDEPRLDQVHEVSIHRRAIDSRMCERLRDLTVGARSRIFFYVAKHHDARLRSPQTMGAEQLIDTRLVLFALRHRARLAPSRRNAHTSFLH